MLSKLVRLFHTVRYLRIIQIYSRIKYKIYKPSISLQNIPIIQSDLKTWYSPIKRKSCLLSKWTFDFLNEQHEVNLVSGWDNPTLSKLWRYNLHYFDDLLADDCHLRLDWHKTLIHQWIINNPAMLGSGWEPYPSSLRIINWIKWSLIGNKLTNEVSHSLVLQIRCLVKRIEYHIMGNHVIANAKALVFSGIFFKGAEAQYWLKTGLEILNREVSEQILNDGAHFELSPMYHAIILEDLLDLSNIARLYPNLISDEQHSLWHQIIPKMIYWLENMVHPDGAISFFNDATFGIAASLYEIQDYAKYLKISTLNDNAELNHFADSGYICIKQGSIYGILDVAKIGPDYLAGHAHADTLSFELSLFGQRVFVNSGISQYGTDDTRLQQRSTHLHNTVTINKQNSSDVWSGFRVAKRAYPSSPEIIKTQDSYSISASHDGYKHLTTKCIHNRQWIFNDSVIRIIDKITGKFTIAVANYYIHPDVVIIPDNNNREVFNLIVNSGQKIQMQVSGADNTKIVSSFWYPGFGIRLINKCISVNFTSDNVEVSITW